MLSKKEKLALIDIVESGLKKTAAALKHDITKSMLMTTVSAKDKLRSSARSFTPDLKRVRNQRISSCKRR